MSYKMFWFGLDLQDYFIAGAITHGFHPIEENKKLQSLIEQEQEIIALFEEKDNMMILTGFDVYKEEQYDTAHILGYLLDDGLCDFITSNAEDPNLSIYVGIIALQYFQFDTLESIILLDEADLESMTPSEREEVEEIRNIFLNMPPEEKDKFLEQELFYYEKEELTTWMDAHS